MVDDAKPTIPGPKPGDATPAAKPAPVVAPVPATPPAPAPAPIANKPVDPPQDKVDAHLSSGFPPVIAKALAAGEDPAPLSDAVDHPVPDAASAQAQRSVDPAEPHGFVEEEFKRDAAGAHPSDLSPAEIVANAEAEHTLAKGLSEDGTAANGLTLGDRV